VTATTIHVAPGDVLTIVADQPATPPPAQNVKVLPTSSTPTDLITALKDTTLDVIRMAAGTYKWPRFTLANIDRTARPVTWDCAAAVFDGNAQVGQIVVGQGGRVTDLTVAGFHGSNWHVSQTGVIWVGNAVRCHFPDANIKATGTGGATAHGIYFSSDGGYGPQACSADRFTFDGVDRSICGLQSYHDPNVRGLRSHGGNVKNAHIGIIADSDGTGLDFADWVIDSVDQPAYFGPNNRGTTVNMKATHYGKAS
jgi:hypothetical protein